MNSLSSLELAEIGEAVLAALALPRAASRPARDLCDGFSPVTPRPVPGSLMLQKLHHPEQIVEAIREVTTGRAPSEA